MLSLLFACTPQDEVLDTSGNATIYIDTDTLLFDTLFSGQKTVTKRFRVYNNSDKAITINEIWLGSGQASPYTMTVNGITAKDVKNLFVLGKDSIYVLVTVLLDFDNKSQPYLVEDSILFNLNGRYNTVYLVAWGRDAVYYSGGTLACNTTWDSTFARFVYQTVTVPLGCTLNISAGTRVYFASGAGIQVNGTLLVNGSAEKRVNFNGPRLESYYANVPNQWNGIIFAAGSVGNQINWANVLNAETGILIGDSTGAGAAASLSVSDVEILNCGESGLVAYNTRIQVANTLIANCALRCLAFYGGTDLEMYYATLASYDYVFFRTVPLMLVSDQLPNGISPIGDRKIKLCNNIIWGTEQDEIDWNISNQTALDSLVKQHNIFKTSNNFFSGDSNQVFNLQSISATDPILFRNDADNDFHLDTLSPATHAGRYLYFLTHDLDNKARKNPPDIGAYQR